MVTVTFCIIGEEKIIPLNDSIRFKEIANIFKGSIYKEIPTNEYRRIPFGSKCNAAANSGFGFHSWVQNLGRNSTKTIATSQISDSAFSFLLTTFGYVPRDNATEFPVIRQGTFTANFKELQPPIPPEYWFPLYGIIVSTIVGWSIPSIINWRPPSLRLFLL